MTITHLAQKNTRKWPDMNPPGSRRDAPDPATHLPDLERHRAHHQNPDAKSRGLRPNAKCGSRHNHPAGSRVHRRSGNEPGALLDPLLDACSQLGTTRSAPRKTNKKWVPETQTKDQEMHNHSIVISRQLEWADLCWKSLEATRAENHELHQRAADSETRIHNLQADVQRARVRALTAEQRLEEMTGWQREAVHLRETIRNLRNEIERLERLQRVGEDDHATVASSLRSVPPYRPSP